MLIETAVLRSSKCLELYLSRHRTKGVKDRIREINSPFTDRQTDTQTDKDCHRKS